MHDPKFDNHAPTEATFERNAPSNVAAPASRSAQEGRSSGDESDTEVRDKTSTSPPTAVPAGVQDCNLCGRSESTEPQGPNGAYACAHCDWKTLSLARLRLHHLEDHDNSEITKLLQQARPSGAVEVGTAASTESRAVDSRDVHRDAEEDAGHSAAGVDEPAADAYSSDDTVLASGPSAFEDDSDFEDEELETDDEVMPRITKRPNITCQHCEFTCVMTSSLRRHHFRKHVEIPFVEPSDRDTSRKRPAPVKVKQAPRKARAKYDSTKMHGYQRDGFVCSDDTSVESGQDECEDEDIASMAMAAPSPLSDGDASWHPSELSVEGTRKDDDTSTDSGEDELSNVCCERCNETFVSKLTLAVHMAKLHRLHYYCFYCGHATKQVEMLRLHHRRKHRKHAFKYLTLDGLKLVTVAHVDSDENEEHTADESMCLVGKPAQHSSKFRYRASSSSRHVKKSSKQRSVSRSPTEHPHSAPRRRKRFIISSSSDEDEGSVHKPEMVRSISRNVYSGYRCAKSVGAFHQLMAKISAEFKCSAFSCGFSTNSVSDFEEHLKGHSLVDVFCIYCGIDVASPGALITHLGQDHGSLRHQCSKCLYRSGESMHFKVHFLQAHPEDSPASIPVPYREGRSVISPASSSELKVFDPYVCGFPGCSFENRKRSDFERHFEEVHAEANSFPCSVCRKGCQSAAALVQHLQEHGFANVQCGYCNFGTGSTGAMMLHACYCHSDKQTVFRVRSENIGEELITYSEMGVRYVASCDLGHLSFQQRCCFCPEMVSGFDNLQRHVTSEHNLSLSVEELADRLFAAYDYTEAVKVSQCPFCSFAVESVSRLQKHVLRQELGIVTFTCSACHRGFDDQLSFQQHVDGGHCSATATMQVCNNGPVLLWTQQNLKFQIHRFGCIHCQETFTAAANFRSHLLRHYTYYPAECKICSQKFRGIRSKEEHMRKAHGGPDTGQGFASSVEQEVVRQTVLHTVHSCPHCNFKSLNQSYVTAHAERCASSVHVVPAQRVVDSEVSGTGNSYPDAEDEASSIYHCMHCSVGFIYLQRLLGHGFSQHGCSYFCSSCYKGFKVKDSFVQHCKGRKCKRPKSMLCVETAKKGSKRAYFFKEISIVYNDDGHISSGDEEDEDMEESGAFSFYNQSYEPVEGIERAYLADSSGIKLSLPDVVRVMNIEPYVRIVDWKRSFF